MNDLVFILKSNAQLQTYTIHNISYYSWKIRIIAFLWLPMTNLLICGPHYFDYKGTTYEIFDITNIDDGEKISAFLSHEGATCCMEEDHMM